MPTVYLEPIDVCGCGDQGFLTTRPVPIDLRHGVGQVLKVPVYHCRSSLCSQYSLPLEVSRRLDDLAEEMEDRQILETDFSWPAEDKKPMSETPTQPLLGTTADKDALVQAFTLQFTRREYDDARVVLIVPGEAVFFQSTVDESEHHLLRFEPETRQQGIWFTFFKFYKDDPSLDLTTLLSGDSEVYMKELGALVLEEVEDALTDTFGDVLLF